MKRAWTVGLLASSLVVVACQGSSDSGSGNFDEARDQQYLQRWCDALVPMAGLGLILGSEEPSPFRERFVKSMDATASRLSESRSPPGLESWHERSSAALRTFVEALKGDASSDTLDELGEDLRTAIDSPFPEAPMSRMQAAADGIDTCMQHPVAGFEFGGVTIGGREGTPPRQTAEAKERD